MSVAIIGGGTISKVKEHLALCAPAYGKVARELNALIPSTLYLTKMAGGSSLETVEDVKKRIDVLIEDKEVKCIIMTAAIVDFSGEIEEAGENVKRLSSKKNYLMHLTPYEKIISKIRKERKDIFLVAFKTTVGKPVEEQYKIGLKMLKTNKCNLVLANDLETKENIIIVPEENYYGNLYREEALEHLSVMIKERMRGTYTPTNFIKAKNIQANYIIMTKTFITVLQECIELNAYKLNDNGFTPGHFCFRINSNTFFSSQRKVNHNDVFQNGMTKCEIEGDVIKAYGSHKPSVGARSQALLLNKYPDYDCIIHFHGKLKGNISSKKQFFYQCGSLECGMNTLNGIKDYNGIKAVHLVKHGPNILFKKYEDPQKVMKFIKDNWILDTID